MTRLRSRSTFSSAALGLAALLCAGRVRGQACCAASSVVTPARLAPLEQALVGVTLRGAGLFGSWDEAGRYAPSPPGYREQDFEQDLFAAARFLRRGQLAVLVPLLETRRVTPDVGQLGGGAGDANVALRVDALSSYETRYLPGIALLAGATLPTGRPPELAHRPLAADATGIGVLQLNAGIELEKQLGPVLLSAAGLFARRLRRFAEGVDEQLGSQWVALVAGAYTFAGGQAVALSASYAVEGDATLDGVQEAETGRRLLTVATSGLWPLSSRVRLLAALQLTPPGSAIGQNQIATAGASVTSIFSWW